MLFSNALAEVHDEPRIVVHFSGTTRPPKPILLTHGAFVSQYFSFCEIGSDSGGNKIASAHFRGLRALITAPVFITAVLYLLLGYNLVYDCRRHPTTMDGDDAQDSGPETHSRRCASYHRAVQDSSRDGSEPELARKYKSVAVPSLPRRTLPLSHRWYYGGEDKGDGLYVLPTLRAPCVLRFHSGRRNTSCCDDFERNVSILDAVSHQPDSGGPPISKFVHDVIASVGQLIA